MCSMRAAEKVWLGRVDRSQEVREAGWLLTCPCPPSPTMFSVEGQEVPHRSKKQLLKMVSIPHDISPSADVVFGCLAWLRVVLPQIVGAF